MTEKEFNLIKEVINERIKLDDIGPAVRLVTLYNRHELINNRVMERLYNCSAIAILTSSHRQREKHAERHKEQYIFYDKCVLLGRHSPRLKQRNVNALP